MRVMQCGHARWSPIGGVDSRPVAMATGRRKCVCETAHADVQGRNPNQQMMDRLLKVQGNKPSKNRRRASRQNDLKERGYSLPQIQIIQEPTFTRRIGGL